MPPTHVSRSLAVLGAVLAGLLAWAPLARAARPWIPPVRGPVVARFSYDRVHRFSAGARRGIELAAAPGAPVGAPCAGVVGYAGRVPQFGAGVSLRCGALTATVLRLGGLRVHRGETVAAGWPLGAAAGRRVRLGARITADRFGYVDPAALLQGRRPAPPLVISRRLPRLGPSGPVDRPVTAPDPAFARPRPVTTAPARPLSPVVWAGLGVLAAALPGGGLVARRRRTRRAATAAGAAAMAR